MEVLQTLGCPTQLLPRFGEENGRESEVTYQLQPVDVIISYEVHDVPVRHPFRHGDELSFLHVAVNPSKLQDVRMRDRSPENSLLAKSLEKDGRDFVQSDGENIGDIHLPYRHEVVLLCNPQALHRDEVTHVCSTPDICKSTRGEHLVFNFNLFRYYHGIR